MILDYNRLSSSCSIKENNFAMRIQRKISRNRNRKTEAVYSLVMRKLSATLVGEKIPSSIQPYFPYCLIFWRQYI